MNPDGSIREWSGACTDITDSIEAHRKIEGERSTLQTALETTPAGIILADADGKIFLSNKSVEKIWRGCTSQPALLSGFIDYTAWETDTGKQLRDDDWPLRRAIKYGETTTGKVVSIERFDGTRGTIIMNASPIRDSEGKITGGVGVSQDISELRETEDALRLSQERYRAMLAATGALTWMASAQGEIQEDSPSWREFTGQSLEDFKRYGWLSAIHPEDRENTKQAWATAVAEGLPYKVEYRLHRYDGEYCWFIAHGEPVRDPNGTIREWVGTSTNIDELKRATERVESEIEKRTQELRSVSVSLRALAETGRTIIHADEEKSLLQRVCRIIVETGGYRLAWCGLIEHDKAKTIRPFAYFGAEEEYLETIQLTWSEDSPGGQGPAGKAARSGKPVISQDVLHDPMMSPWLEEARKRDFKACNPTLERGREGLRGLDYLCFQTEYLWTGASPISIPISRQPSLRGTGHSAKACADPDARRVAGKQRTLGRGPTNRQSRKLGMGCKNQSFDLV
jgi:PAS domain S-box-containing protein